AWPRGGYRRRLNPSGESFEGSPKGGCSLERPAVASVLRKAGRAVWPTVVPFLSVGPRTARKKEHKNCERNSDRDRPGAGDAWTRRRPAAERADLLLLRRGRDGGLDTSLPRPASAHEGLGRLPDPRLG